MHSLFKTLGCELRIEIIRYLLEKDDFTCICEVEDLIDRDRSVVYRHFRKLESEGIIETRKNGRKVEAAVKRPEEIKNLFQIAEKMNRKN